MPVVATWSLTSGRYPVAAESARAPAGCWVGRRGVGETVTAPTLLRWPTPEGGRDRGQHARARDTEDEGGQEEVASATRAGTCRHCWSMLSVLGRLSVRGVAELV
jgi:hypothetical protein